MSYAPRNYDHYFRYPVVRLHAPLTHWLDSSPHHTLTLLCHRLHDLGTHGSWLKERTRLRANHSRPNTATEPLLHKLRVRLGLRPNSTGYTQKTVDAQFAADLLLLLGENPADHDL